MTPAPWIPDAYGRTPGSRGERFPGFDVLRQVGTWDAVTTGVVLARLGPPPPLRFFAPQEEAVARPLLDQLLDQRDDPRVPVLETIDARLAEAQTDGWHYDDMPEDGQAWRDSLRGLDADAEKSRGRGFAQLSWSEQAQTIQAVRDRGDEPWSGLPAARVWSLWTRYAATAFYAHPWAWNEIGFGGPAYPRGYKNLGLDRREPWEVRDVHPDRDPIPSPGTPGHSGGGQPTSTSGTPSGRQSPTASPSGRALADARNATRFFAGSGGNVRDRNASAWLLPAGDERTDHGLRRAMRRYDDGDQVDAVVIGCGAGGGTLTQRLSRAGWRVVALDAGPFWDPDTDWVSDEAGSHHLYWTEPRVIGGSDPVPLGSNNSGRGVGGSMVHFAGYTPRFHPSDFATRTNDGVGADWPITYHDLRPYYQAIEEELPVAGQPWPWGDPHRYPHSPHPVSGDGLLFQAGCHARGIPSRVGPVAITNGRFGNRPHCIYRGFCLQGCKVNAKASPLITHVPDALAHGAEIRANCMVTRIAVDDRTGQATGVHYLRGGVEHVQRARLVALAGYSIETPRLLLNSAGRRFPDGLCNDHDQVGRYLMVQGAPQTAGRFTTEVRAYKAPPPSVSTEAFYETDPTKPYRRGFSIQTVSPLPITFAEHVLAQGHWGGPLREYMRDYIHWATLGALCEFLPQADNRVTLAEETDRYGLPVAKFSYSQCDNDRHLVAAAQEQMEDILRAAGAEEVVTIKRYAHLVGGARMAARPEEGVVDAHLRTFAVPNLYITDGSVLPTQGSANPALTIMALAARAAHHLTTGSS